MTGNERRSGVLALLAAAAALSLSGCASSPLLEASSMGQDDQVKALLDHGANIEERASGPSYCGHYPKMNRMRAGGETPLICATMNGNYSTVKLLLERGADTSQKDASQSTAYGYAGYFGRADIAGLLKRWMDDPHLRREKLAAQREEFGKSTQAYRDAAVKPELPEDARRFKIEAEEAVKDKRFQRASERYQRALEVSPWWPEGHFNRALVLAEQADYTGAVDEMKRYMILVPEGVTARAAQDKIYAWEDKGR